MVFSCPDSSTAVSCELMASKKLSSGVEADARALRERGRELRGELGMRVDARADRRAALREPVRRGSAPLSLKMLLKICAAQPPSS